jgi:hypothetical protein
LVLKWDKFNETKFKHTSFQNWWLDPYQVAKQTGVGMYQLQILEGDIYLLPVNG